MKIAWFTPFSRKSAIARFSDAVVRELSSQCTVDLWCPRVDDPRSSEMRTIFFKQASEVDPTKLASYDLLVYNLGNYLSFHRGIYEVSRLFPGIVVMHDFVMHHFFVEYYLNQLQQPQMYVAAMQRTAGAEGAALAEQILAGRRPRVWETEEVVRYPLFQEAVRGALGVITHSKFFRRKVEVFCPAPVTDIHLAYDASPPKDSPPRERLGIPNSRLLMISFGHVNPNRRVSSVLGALAANRDLLERVIYVVLGPCEPRYLAELRAAIKRQGLQSSVRLLGYVDDETLRVYLQHADFCVNLRFPTTEGASASLIEAMLFGKSVVVTDTGCYREVPDDCVIKIRPEHEHTDLVFALRRLATDARARETIGSSAREFAKKHHCASHYASEFIKFAWQVRHAKPLMQLADRLATELKHIGVTQEMQIVDIISEECERLFCVRPKRRPGDV